MDVTLTLQALLFFFFEESKGNPNKEKEEFFSSRSPLNPGKHKKEGKSENKKARKKKQGVEGQGLLKKDGVSAFFNGEKKTDKEKSHKGIWRSDAPEASQGQTRDVPGTPGIFGADLCVNQY